LKLPPTYPPDTPQATHPLPAACSLLEVVLKEPKEQKEQKECKEWDAVGPESVAYRVVVGVQTYVC
jgi:hypothetical protein